MKYNVEIDSDSIHEFSKNIVVEGNKFIELIDDLLKEVMEMEIFFDTPTGKSVKERMIDSLNNQKNIVNNKYIGYSKTIEKIANIYDQTNDSIKTSVGISGAK